MGRARGGNTTQTPRRRGVGVVVLEGGEHEGFPVTPGVLDDRAARAFTAGQCHAFALAMHERTGWPLRVIEDEGGDPVHCFVADPDGRAVDICGVHDRDVFADRWGTYDEPADPGSLRALAHGFGGWRIPRVDVARQFVDPVLALHAAGIELYEPGSDTIPAAECPAPSVEQFSVVARDGASHTLPAGVLDDTVRGYLHAEQSYALAFALTRALNGGPWRVGYHEDDDEALHAYAVDPEAGVAVDAYGAHSLRDVPALQFAKLKLIAEAFDEAGYVAPDHGMAGHYAPLLAAALV